MSNESEKIYAPGLYVREHTFQSTGNTILKVGVDVAKFIAFLNQHADEKGQVRIGISRRKTASDNGITHCAWLDTWRPQPKQQPRAEPQPEPRRASVPADAARGQDTDDSQLPF